MQVVVLVVEVEALLLEVQLEQQVVDLPRLVVLHVLYLLYLLKVDLFLEAETTVAFQVEVRRIGLEVANRLLVA